jgi:hypothetical protein
VPNPKAPGPAQVTTSAKVTSGTEVLEAVAAAWSEGMREVYRRAVVGGEEWFAKDGKGLRSELIRRGWSQREATSMFVAAQGAQDGAVESAKLAMETVKGHLEQVGKKLTWAMAGTSAKRKSKRHGLARRRDTLAAQARRLERRLEAGDVRVCFGGRKLAVAGNDPAAHGYADRDEWRERWDRERSGQWFAQGDKEFPSGCPSARISLSSDRASGSVSIRVPSFLRGQLGCGEWHEIAVAGFSWRRDELARAMSWDQADLAARCLGWQDKTAHWGVQRSVGASEALLSHYGLKKPSATAPRLHTGSAVSVRLSWREEKQSWYAHASFETPAGRVVKRAKGLVLGIDLNPDHVAWCLVSADGNPLRWGRVDINLSGPANQNAASIGRAVAQLVALARRYGAIVAHEVLDFSRKRAELRYLSRRLAQLLSSFAYNKFAETLSSRCAREGLVRCPVDPAWTSVLGQADYAGVYGVSVDQGAACVIARRALGFRTSVRPQVARRVPRCGLDEHTSLPEAARLKLVAKALSSGPHKARRRSTWDPSGLCLRRHSAPCGPQGGCATPAPAQVSLPTPKASQGMPSRWSHAARPLRLRRRRVTRHPGVPGVSRELLGRGLSSSVQDQE